MFYVLQKKKQLHILTVFFVILSVLIAGFIFSNSSQKAEDSNKKSDAISETMQPVLDPDNSIEEADFKAGTRKAAHVIEFLTLGLSVGAAFLCIYKQKKRLFVSLPLLLTLSVAVTDEFIQSFHGRTSTVKDVLIDCGGAFSGIFVIFLIAVLPQAIRRMKKNKK